MTLVEAKAEIERLHSYLEIVCGRAASDEARATITAQETENAQLRRTITKLMLQQRGLTNEL